MISCGFYLTTKFGLNIWLLIFLDLFKIFFKTKYKSKISINLHYKLLNTYIYNFKMKHPLIHIYSIWSFLFS